ncbi:MAG: Gx transporter family protein, partial [Butyricicoccus sp.]|nr:Gx transporter family protein [Butyricicoccus sp.]
RVIVVSLLFGNPMTFIYSIVGAMLSLAVMVLLKKMNFLSCVGVSVAGAAAHNIGQICAAIGVLGTTDVVGYLPLLLVSAVPMGLVTGLTAQETLAHLDKISGN